MEPVLIMKTASVLLAIAALGGLAMAGIRFGGKPQPPIWLAMLHGFLSAAAGGAFLNLNYHWKMLPLPKGMIVGHAGIAVVGFGLLLAALWTGTRS